MEDLRVVEIDITNFEQIENLVIRPGTITVVEGANDRGKTAVLNAVRSFFDMAHDPSMVRHGAEKAIVVMTLSDGSSFTNTIKRSGMEVVVKNAEGLKIGGRNLAKEFASGVNYDPGQFLRKSKKDRGTYFEQVMPMRIAASDVIRRLENRAYAPAVQKLLTAPDYNLSELLAVRQKCFDDRSLCNKDMARIDGTIATLQKALPDGWKPGDDMQLRIEEAERSVNSAREGVATVEKALSKEVHAFNLETAGEISSVDKWEAAEIDRIRIEARGKRDAITERVGPGVERLELLRADELEEARAKVEAASAELGTVRQQAKDEERLLSTKRDLDKHWSDRRAAQFEVNHLEACMQGIDRAKAARLKDMPIPGLSFANGEVYYQKPDEDEPIAFDLHNQQTQMLIALKLATLDDKKLPIILMDQLESFDRENREELFGKIKATGYQVMFGRVIEDGPLEIVNVA